ncbi:MAG: hypothetical protein LZF61_08670 [Nitrosomonas sp.]|nr:MAG: hypothetical protein LZF61_08670 [Nitrosomonas sp.]
MKTSSERACPISSMPSKSRITVLNFSKRKISLLARDLDMSFSPSYCPNRTGAIVFANVYSSGSANLSKISFVVRVELFTSRITQQACRVRFWGVRSTIAQSVLMHEMKVSGSNVEKIEYFAGEKNSFTGMADCIIDHFSKTIVPNIFASQDQY